MKIVNKISLVLWFFLIIIVFLGLGSIYVINKQMLYFSKINSYIHFKENTKECSNLFLSQMKSFDYYAYLTEDSEKYNFLEKKEKLLESIDKAASIKNIDIDIGKLKSRIILVNVKVGKLLEGSRRDIIKKNEKEVLPLVDNVKEGFKKIILQANYQIRFFESKTDFYKRSIKKYFFISFAVTIAFLVFFSFNIFKSIQRPLKEFEKATYALGKGNLNYQIKIKEKNEFLTIAKSFNKMVKSLKEFQFKITQMSKMAAVGELAGGVAHEINNPLTGILGQSQRLLQRIPKDSEIFSIIKKMERAALRCRDIVSDLLDFSRQEESDFRLISINKVLEDTFSTCETDLISKEIRLEKEYSPNLPMVKISQKTIQHVFLNIINNSIYAMPGGGVLIVSTELKMINENRCIEIKFKDTGHGFTDDIKERLFDPFFTTKEPGKGTGLGLSLAYRIIRRHKGFMFGESEGISQGALFTVQLPLE